MFRTVRLPIIRSLFTVHSAMVYVIQANSFVTSHERISLAYRNSVCHNIALHIQRCFHRTVVHYNRCVHLNYNLIFCAATVLWEVHHSKTTYFSFGSLIPFFFFSPFTLFLFSLLLFFWGGGHSQNCEERQLALSCPSVLPHETTRLELEGFSWHLIFECFSKICPGKIKFHWNWIRITGSLHEDQYTFSIISLLILLRIRNISDKSAHHINLTVFRAPAKYKVV
jgi:hypothetical protein